jgi:ATP-binding cassette subfamily C exporter for protease/lipase
MSLQSLVLGLGALLVLDNKITSGMMIAASILLGRTLAAGAAVIAVWKSWSSTRSAYRAPDDAAGSQSARRPAWPAGAARPS